MHYYIQVLKNYGNFTGRASRKEFWVYQMVNLLLTLTTILADNAMGTCFKYDLGYGVQLLPFGYIFAVYALATFLPTLAVEIRRLHDLGKSGWFLFVVLIPIIGAIYLLVLYCTDSNAGDNKYGPDSRPV